MNKGKSESARRSGLLENARALNEARQLKLLEQMSPNDMEKRIVEINGKLEKIRQKEGEFKQQNPGNSEKLKKLDEKRKDLLDEVTLLGSALNSAKRAALAAMQATRSGLTK